MRKQNAAAVFTAGLIIAAFVSIPIVNLATPLFGMAFMVHMHKRLSGARPELIEPAQRREISARGFSAPPAGSRHPPVRGRPDRPGSL
jgi:CysZ protein